MSEKPWGHFGGHSFCKVLFLKIFIKNMDFQAPGDCSYAVYRAAVPKQRLAPRLRAAPLFAFLLAAQSVFEFTVLQLTGECFAPPSAMICAVAMSRADSGMGVGSSSFKEILNLRNIRRREAC